MKRGRFVSWGHKYYINSAHKGLNIMKQTGYIIENLLDKSKYFTSTSSYDRPQWVKKEQASVYETAVAVS